MSKRTLILVALILVGCFVYKNSNFSRGGVSFEGRWTKTEGTGSEQVVIPYHVIVDGKKFRVESVSKLVSNQQRKVIVVSDGKQMQVYQPKYPNSEPGVINLNEVLSWNGEYETVTIPMPDLSGGDFTTDKSKDAYPWPEGTFWWWNWAHVWQKVGPGDQVLGRDTVKYQFDISGATAVVLLDKKTGVLLKEIQPIGSELECKEIRFGEVNQDAFLKA